MTGWYVIFILSADTKLIYIFYIYTADNVNLSKNIVKNNAGSYSSSTSVTE
jgi:hypothetical protein